MIILEISNKKDNSKQKKLREINRQLNNKRKKLNQQERFELLVEKWKLESADIFSDLGKRQNRIQGRG